MKPIVSLTSVSRRYQTSGAIVTAVHTVSLDLSAGQLVGIAGPSGSGKSTLLDILAGWQQPDEGIVAYHETLRAGWAGISLVPQDIGLLAELTARENVQLAGGRRLLGRTIADTALEELGLGELARRRAHEMSMGEQQRVAVARATVAAPMVLVADEPTAHQDEANTDRVVEVLRRCADAGSAVVVATHDDRVLARLDRVLQLIDGRMQSFGRHDVGHRR